MDDSLGQTMQQVRKQASTNTRGWKFYESFHKSQWYETRSHLQKDKADKKEYVETKQYATRRPMGQW